jgi:exopolyphosphatase/guanosine-5'-triphosphate,3'-diphosphate pyrophosphatase
VERIGIIDLGSNSSRLVIVEVLEDNHFVIIDEIKESVRLGQDMERDGFLKPVRIAETIKTIKMFRKLCDSYHIEKIIAFATAAVRRAKNQRSFLDEVAATCGIKLKVLSAEEESTYIYQGVINSMDIPKGLILEIGGGSTKMVYYNRRNILARETLPFGAVTLTDLFAQEGLKPEEQAEKIEEFFTEQLSKIEWLKELDPETQFIGVGGSFRNVCRIAKMVKKYPLDTIHNYRLPVEDFDNVYGMVRVLDLDKKKKIKGISSARADILPAAMAIVKAFLKFTNFNEIVISGNGLREGILYNYTMPITIEKPISDVMGNSLRTIVTQYGMDAKHVDQVVNLSVQLFKQLRVLHKFPRQYLKILKIAATLHDTGMQVKYYNHHRHGMYVCINSNLCGVTHREMVMAGLVIGAHKDGEVSPADILRYRALVSEEDVDAIKKLGVILKIAESLDRSAQGLVTGLDCDVLGDSVIMKTTLTGDATLEIHDAMTSELEFRKAFHKNLEIL